MCPLYIWRRSRERCRVIVLNVMSHTFGKTDLAWRESLWWTCIYETCIYAGDFSCYHTDWAIMTSTQMESVWQHELQTIVWLFSKILRLSHFSFGKLEVWDQPIPSICESWNHLPTPRSTSTWKVSTVATSTLPNNYLPPHTVHIDHSTHDRTRANTEAK